MNDLLPWKTSKEVKNFLGVRGREDIPMFVYGTLRYGGTLHAHYADGIVGVDRNLTTKGDLHYVCSSFPGANLDGEGTIAGDILWYDSQPEVTDLYRMLWMEVGAGYEIRVVNVRAEQEETIEALSLHYRHIHRLLDPVPNGDWMSKQAQSERGVSHAW